MTAGDKGHRGESVEPEVRRLLRFATTQIEHKLSGDVARWFADVGALLGDGDVPRTAEAPLCFHAAKGERCTRYLEGSRGERAEIVAWLRTEADVQGPSGYGVCAKILHELASNIERGVAAKRVRESPQPSAGQIETPPKLAAGDQYHRAYVSARDRADAAEALLARAHGMLEGTTRKLEHEIAAFLWPDQAAHRTGTEGGGT